MRVYLAGPMSRHPEFNFPAFFLNEHHLLSQGHEVFNPARQDVEIHGFDPAGLTGHEDVSTAGGDLRTMIQADTGWITTQAEGIYLLHGWRESTGARAEFALAQWLNLQAQEEGTGEWVSARDIDPRPVAAPADAVAIVSRLRLGGDTGTLGMDAALGMEGATIRRRDQGSYLTGHLAFQNGQWDWVETFLPAVHEPLQMPVASGLPGTGEVRTFDPETGAAKGMKPERFDLVPVRFLQEVARVYGVGAAKYAPRNWEAGYDWSKSYAAAMRHLTSWWGGEDNDPELGTPHLAHVAWHMSVLIEFTHTHPGKDDRPATIGSAGSAGALRTPQEPLSATDAA